MKLSFTTLGCPEWDLNLVIKRAAQYGFDAIDFRGLNGEMNIWKLPEFSEAVRNTREQIQAAGLSVSCFSSSVKVFSREELDKNVKEVKEYAKLCSIFETPFIRVFGGSIGNVGREEAVKVIAEHFRILSEEVKEYGVKLLLETHDDWTSCADVKAVLELIEPEAIGVLWDLHHPYRTLGEQPEETLKELGKHIRYTHVKDSFIKPDGEGAFQYCLTGQGDIPLDKMCRLLSDSGYDGYYTLEWEKKWHPELESAEVAFPQYVQYMRNLASVGRPFTGSR